MFSCNIHKIQPPSSDRPPLRRIEWPRPIITKQRSIRYGSRNFAHPQLRRPPVRPHGRRQRHRHGGRLYCQPRHRGRRPGRRHRDRGPGVQPLAGREQHHRTALRGLRPGGRKARLPSRPHRGRADLFRPGHPGPPGNDPRQRPHRGGGRAGGHPAPPPLFRRRRKRLRARHPGRQRPRPVVGRHPYPHHRPPGPPQRVGPQRHRLLPRLHRQRRLQRGVSHLGNAK